MSYSVSNTALGFTRLWRHIDCQDQILGRLATQITNVLMGKHKPFFDPKSDIGDYVIVTNARLIKVTGKKQEQKIYYSHSQYPGALKKIPFFKLMQKNPTMILKKAVSGMLPKNKLRDRRLNRLLIFPDDSHPYHANLFKDYTEKQPTTPVLLPPNQQLSHQFPSLKTRF